jgi:putative FmdB family regulatory protein
MPLYEYVCLDCEQVFDALRSMREADDPIACTRCRGDQTSRKISLFAAHSDGKVVAGGGKSCTSCYGGVCTTCGG